MGSSGYLTCGICWQCGACYPRASHCPCCGGPISLGDDACEACGAPIGDDMRARAREEFMAAKLAEFQKAGTIRIKRPAGP